MARYYFHLRDHDDDVLDPEGVELADHEAVRIATLEGVRDLIAADVRRDGTIDFRYRLDVENAASEVVYSLGFKDTVSIIEEP